MAAHFSIGILAHFSISIYTSCIEEYVRCVFDNAKVNIKDENAVSVDIEVTGKNELHSLEGLKELEYYFKDYDIRIW